MWVAFSCLVILWLDQITDPLPLPTLNLGKHTTSSYHNSECILHLIQPAKLQGYNHWFPLALDQWGSKGMTPLLPAPSLYCPFNSLSQSLLSLSWLLPSLPIAPSIPLEYLHSEPPSAFLNSNPHLPCPNLLTFLILSSTVSTSANLPSHSLNFCPQHSTRFSPCLARPTLLLLLTEGFLNFKLQIIKFIAMNFLIRNLRFFLRTIQLLIFYSVINSA